MNKKGFTDRTLAISTMVLAVATIGLAVLTYLLVSEAKQSSFRQIGVQTWLELEKRFDSPEMIRAKKKLAQQLKAKPVKYDELSESVFDFFEDMGVAYKAGYLDKKLAFSSFSLYATRYWEAAKPFVDEDRRRYGGDVTVWEDFEYVAKTMLQRGEKIDDRQLQQFLEDESNLVVN